MTTIDTEVDTEVACNTMTATPVPKKGPIKKRAWMLTINNPTELDEEILKTDSFEYLKYQIEKGESGTEHIQAFIYYKNARVWPKKRYPNAHIEACISINASIKYVGKEDTRVRGPYEFGTMPEQGKRHDLEKLAMEILIKKPSIKEIALENPDLFIRYEKGLKALVNIITEHRTEKPTVIWVFGLAGKGKTRKAYESDENVYFKDETKWWDNYANEPTIIIDDFDGMWPFRNLLRLLDRYPIQTQFKGGYTKFNTQNIWITCEFHPKYCYGPENVHANGKTSKNDYNQIVRRLDKIIEICDRVEIEHSTEFIE